MRRRGSWEALDAGLLLWRENCACFLLFFAVPFWISAFGLCLLPKSMRLWSWLILWLLKPLFDRSLLHVISVRFFEPGADMRRLCRGIRKSLCRGLAGDLLWRRFSPLRAAMMPVRVLEDVPRRRIRERRQSLQKGGLGFCSFLTIWGMALEPVLLGGETLFCVIMAELIQTDVFSRPYAEILNTGEIFLFAAWCVNYMLVESLYICMGFGLYLNSRVEVEGWDIEILFRRFAGKHKKNDIGLVQKSAWLPNRFNVSRILVFCVVLVMALPLKGFAANNGVSGNGPASSDEINDMPANGGILPDDGVPLETLRAVLDSPDFGGQRDGWGIRWKNPRQPKETSGIDISPWLDSIRRFFALALRLVLIALVAAMAVFLIVYLRKWGHERITPRDSRKIKGRPKILEESPESLLEKARNFFGQGNLRLAWGFCTAAAVRSWQVYRGLHFPPDATEYGCVDIVNASDAGDKNEMLAFAALVNNWTALAYGGRLPPAESFREALAFCKSLEGAND
jgi:hypothetical protein